MMDVESVRAYCLSLPQATEDTPFDFNDYGGIVAWRVLGRIFAMIDLDNTEWFVLKCDPDLAIDLRDRHAEVTPAWHMNKRHWNQVSLRGSLADSLITSMIRHSYALVAAKLTRKALAPHPEVSAVRGDMGQG